MIEVTPRKQNVYNSKSSFKDSSDNHISIFLAGTIDSGNSVNWQQEIINNLQEYDLQNLTIYNPRRLDWPSDADHEEMQFQIKWEQEHLDKADIIIMVLTDTSKSPITLLEMGLYAKSKKLYVFCTDKFYRYDNVKLTCDKYNVPLINTTNTEKISEYIFDKIKNKDNKTNYDWV